MCPITGTAAAVSLATASGYAAAAATVGEFGVAASLISSSSILAATSIAGVAMSTISGYNQSKAAQDQAKYQAAVSRNNQIIADRQAEDTLKRGEIAANAQRLKAQQFASRQFVTMAGQGVDVTNGSSVNLLADTAELGQFDAEKIKGNARQASYEQRVQGYNAGTQAGLYDAQARAQNPLLAGTSTFFSKAGNVASRWQS